MAQFASKSHLLLRRLLTAMAEKVKPQARAVSSASSVAKSTTSETRMSAAAVIESGGERAAEGGKTEIFWMRDPKTGNWKPENHFNEVDPVDLRQRILGNKQRGS